MINSASVLIGFLIYFKGCWVRCVGCLCVGTQGGGAVEGYLVCLCVSQHKRFFYFSPAVPIKPSSCRLCASGIVRSRYFRYGILIRSLPVSVWILQEDRYRTSGVWVNRCERSQVTRFSYSTGSIYYSLSKPPDG